MAKNSLRRYAVLFLSVFRLSACTFGGGFVIIPLMRKQFVEKLGWMEEEEMLDLTAIAQSSPGAIAVNASVLVGYRVAGISGAFLAVLGTVLPPLGIISVISVFYQAFRDHAVVNMAMAGMLCGAAAVIFDVVVSMAGAVFRQKRILPILVMTGALIAVRLFPASIMGIMLLCGAIGAADTCYRSRRQKGGDRG